MSNDTERNDAEHAGTERRPIDLKVEGPPVPESNDMGGGQCRSVGNRPSTKTCSCPPGEEDL